MKKRPSRTPVEQLANVLVRPFVYWLFHSWRLFGWSLVIPPLMVLKPLRTVAAVAAYAVIHRKLWWQRAVHRFFGYGASRRHRIVNEHKHLILDDKRYLWSLHPHSVLADGWHSIIACNLDSFETGPPELGRKIGFCFAPIIRHVPVHQEMYRDKCGNADKRSITNWWKTDTDPALIPGGFAESVFANSAERKYEYSYLKDRAGFVRISIEAGKDIVPIYTFRSTWMYYNPSILRGWRARFSQNYYIGLVPFIGWMGTSMPHTDKTTTVVFPPFLASSYKMEQLDESHQAFLAHLKTNFDINKVRFGMRDTELIFVGSDYQDEDSVSKALTKWGVISRPKKSKL